MYNITLFMREQLAYNSNADKGYIAQWSVESALQVSTIGDPLSKNPALSTNIEFGLETILSV